MTGSPLLNTQVSKSLLITDDDGPSLSLALDRNTVGEAAGFNTAHADHQAEHAHQYGTDGGVVLQ